MRNKLFYKKKKKETNYTQHTKVNTIKPIVDKEKPRIRVYI